jgi:hypothetical protein
MGEGLEEEEKELNGLPLERAFRFGHKSPFFCLLVFHPLQTLSLSL